MNKKSLIPSLNFGIETVIYIIVSLLLGFLVPQINTRMFPDWFSQINMESMTAILSAIASGMITLSGLVFSLVFVLVQFGSVTYSLRITRIFAHTYVLRHSLGIFTGTFLYSLMALRAIGLEQTPVVSALTVWIAFLWLLASVFILTKLISVFTAMTISNILSALSTIGYRSILRIYPQSYQNEEQRVVPKIPELTKNSEMKSVLYQGPPLYVNEYNFDDLRLFSVKNECYIRFPYAIGDSVKDGAAIAYFKEERNPVSPDVIKNAITLSIERTFKNDPKYAIRLLVDTAIRALSPAINDPTTAVQVLDHLESLLVRLGRLHLDTGIVSDQNNKIRIEYNTPSWNDYLQLAFTEIMQYGASSIQVERRLEALLTFLIETVPPERKKEVIEFRNQRRSLVDENFTNVTFKQWANVADREGIGNGGDGAVLLKN